MIDSEDILNSVISYLTEVVGSKSRINNAIDSVNSEKGDSMLPNVSNDIIIGQRLQEINTFTNGRLNIDIVGEAKIQPEYAAIAKRYSVELSFIARDDLSTNAFLRALRMERVISDVMVDFFKESQEAGFIAGEIVGSFTPERVFLGNSEFRAIKSGIVYKILIQ